MTSRRNFITTGAAGLTAVSFGSPYLKLMSTASAQEPVKGGHLTAAMILEPASLDPIFGNAPGLDRCAYNLFNENLIFQDEKGQFRPWLAESWELADDGLSYTFKLRPGVMFQDGTPFDAEAVKFNLERSSSEEVNSRARQYMTDFASVEVIDPLTAKVNLQRPSGPFLTVLANAAGSMVSPTAVRERGADFARSPIGTGPFIITGWAAGKIDGERFDGYWGKPPYLDKVSVRTISNTAVKLVELKSGTVHIGDVVQVKDIPEIEADPNLTPIDTIRVITSYISFNNQAAPFKDNIHLRKAVAHAINREAIEKAISRGEGGVMAGFDPPASQTYGPELVGHTYDPELAAEEFKKANHADPLTLLVIQRDPDTQIAQLIQAMCKAVGIDLRIQVLERLAWVERVLNYDYELGVLRAAPPDPDPDMTYSQFYGRTANNDYSGIKNPEIWDMIDEARALSDMEERRRIYIAIQQMILDNYWQTYMFWRPQKEVARKELHNFEREYNGAWYYNNMWLSDA